MGGITDSVTPPPKVLVRVSETEDSVLIERSEKLGRFGLQGREKLRVEIVDGDFEEGGWGERNN